jgi:LysM repeat protein
MKIKIPRFLRRKPKKFRATAARRPLRIGATADYDEMSEPNMKLSRALLIVLVLHVVAVSGIIAFNAIKTRQNSNPPPVNAATASTSAAATATKPNASNPRPAGAGQKETAARRDDSKASRSPGKAIAKEDHKTEHAKSGGATVSGDSEKVYVVAKGDTPVTIAKKLKVSYDELLTLNHIEDPRKLQIGQKLRIPEKKIKSKHAED